MSSFDFVLILCKERVLLLSYKTFLFFSKCLQGISRTSVPFEMASSLQMVCTPLCSLAVTAAAVGEIQITGKKASGGFSWLRPKDAASAQSDRETQPDRGNGASGDTQPTPPGMFFSIPRSFRDGLLSQRRWRVSS